MAAIAPPADGPRDVRGAVSRAPRAIFRYCRSIVRDEQDALDVLQTTFTKAFASLQRETRQIDPRPWLFRIAHNESISLLRDRRPEPRLDDVPEPGRDWLEDVVATREDLRQLQEDLGDLAERHRSALLLRELSGLGYAEIAEVLDTTPNVVRGHVFEARSALHACREGRSMRCEEVRRAVSNGDRRELKARRLRAHLRWCSSCGEFAIAIQERPAQLQALVPVLPLATSVLLLEELLPGAASAQAGAVSGGALAAGASTGGAAATTAASVTGAAVTGGAAVSGGAAATGGLVAGGVAAIGGKVAVVAATVAIAAGGAGGVAVLSDGLPRDAGRPAPTADDRAERATHRPAADAAPVRGIDGRPGAATPAGGPSPAPDAEREEPGRGGAAGNGMTATAGPPASAHAGPIGPSAPRDRPSEPGGGFSAAPAAGSPAPAPTGPQGPQRQQEPQEASKPQEPSPRPVPADLPRGERPGATAPAREDRSGEAPAPTQAPAADPAAAQPPAPSTATRPTRGPAPASGDAPSAPSDAPITTVPERGPRRP
jgi:RNA polymerase sigma factor (sigma-70 family)